MPNSMDINMGGDNSISNLSFIWKARFSDGSIISQYENGIEHRFQEVKDKFKDLIYFTLYSNTKIFTVDLKKGIIFFNNHQKVSEDLSKQEKQNIRLIFFRRHTVELTEKLEQQKHKIIYFLGFQYSDKNNQNRQILLQIDSKGNCILGE